MARLAETCSHVGAVLHWVETAVRVRNDTPSTSKENRWLMPTPVKDIPYLEPCMNTRPSWLQGRELWRYGRGRKEEGEQSIYVQPMLNISGIII